MHSLSEIGLNEFKEAITPEYIRTSRIIYSSIALGVIVLGIITALLYTQHSGGEITTASSDFANILTAVNFLLAVSMIFIGKIVVDKQYIKGKMQEAVNREYRNEKGKVRTLNPARQCLSLIRAASIIRLATLEAPALLGLIIIISLALSQPLDPVYLLNALTSLPLFYVVITTFPGEENLYQIFQEKFKRNM